MTGGRLRRFCEHVYMLSACAFLLWDIAYMTEAGWTFALREFFPGAICALAVAALLLSRMKLGAGWLPAGLLVWMTAVSAWRGVHVLAGEADGTVNGVLAFLVLLPAPRIVGERRMMWYLRAVLALWTAFLTLQAATGLWAALSGHAVFSLRGTWYIGVNLGDHRLYLNAYVTTGAVKLGLSVLLAGLGAAISRRRAARAAYILCMTLQLACLALTDCRTAFLAVGAGLGAMAFAGLLHTARPGDKRRLRRLCALLAVPVIALGAYLALSGLLTALAPQVPQEMDNITLLEIPAHLLPEASAEAAEAVQHRRLEMDNLFNNRQIIWEAGLRLLRWEPRYLLTGTGNARAQVLTNMYIPYGVYDGQNFAHVHSIYLQTLISWGLPGFALLAAFLIVFLRAAWRVMTRYPLPLWQRLTPVPVLYVLLCDAVDCFTRLAAGSPLLYWGCLFAGLTLVIDRRARGQERIRAAEARHSADAVDVIIPVYNAAAYVARAVDSALGQPMARVILVDDGSTDGSGRLCDALAAANSRVTVLHQENRGASAARNAGLQASGAAYVAFLDADDILLPGALALLLSCMDGADAAQGRIVRETPRDRAGEACVRLPAREALRRALTDPTRHLLCHGWIFRRELLTERFDERLSMGEDGQWLLRTLQGAREAVMCAAPVYRYTVRGDSSLHGPDGERAEAYLRTLEAAAPALAGLDMPCAAAMYRLTHLLLMLTHTGADMARLRELPLFDQAFRTAKLRGLSPRICTLRLLKRRWYPLAKAAVGLRRLQNRLACRKS